MKLEEYIRLFITPGSAGETREQDLTSTTTHHIYQLSHALTCFQKHKEVSSSVFNSKMEFILLADNEKMNNPQQCCSFKFTTSALSGVISQTTLSAFKN